MDIPVVLVDVCFAAPVVEGEEPAPPVVLLTVRSVEAAQGLLAAMQRFVSDLEPQREPSDLVLVRRSAVVTTEEGIKTAQEHGYRLDEQMLIDHWEQTREVRP